MAFARSQRVATDTGLTDVGTVTAVVLIWPNGEGCISAQCNDPRQQWHNTARAYAKRLNLADHRPSGRQPRVHP